MTHEFPKKGFYCVPRERNPVIKYQPNSHDVMKYKDCSTNQFFRKKTYRQGRRSRLIYWGTVDRVCDHGQGRLLESVSRLGLGLGHLQLTQLLARDHLDNCRQESSSADSSFPCICVCIATATKLEFLTQISKLLYLFLKISVSVRGIDYLFKRAKCHHTKEIILC